MTLSLFEMAREQTGGTSYRMNIRMAVIASCLLHFLAAVLFFVMARHLESYDGETLVLDLTGLETDLQMEDRLSAQEKGINEPTPQSASAEKKISNAARDAPLDEAGPTESSLEKGGASAVTGSGVKKAGGDVEIAGDEAQRAQTLNRHAAVETVDWRVYVSSLSKRVQHKLVYPREARHSRLEGATTVSFRILSDGNILMESLRVVVSSGMPVLDESALQTIRASVPFVPPPAAVTVQMAVTYGRKR